MVLIKRRTNFERNIVTYKWTFQTFKLTQKVNLNMRRLRWWIRSSVLTIHFNYIMHSFQILKWNVLHMTARLLLNLMAKIVNCKFLCLIFCNGIFSFLVQPSQYSHCLIDVTKPNNDKLYCCWVIAMLNCKIFWKYVKQPCSDKVFKETSIFRHNK